MTEGSPNAQGDESCTEENARGRALQRLPVKRRGWKGPLCTHRGCRSLWPVLKIAKNLNVVKISHETGYQWKVQMQDFPWLQSPNSAQRLPALAVSNVFFQIARTPRSVYIYIFVMCLTWERFDTVFLFLPIYRCVHTLPTYCTGLFGVTGTGKFNASTWLRPQGLCALAVALPGCFSTRYPHSSLPPTFKSSSNITQAFPDHQAYHFNSHTLGSASRLSFLKHLPLIFPIFYLNILDNCPPHHHH